MGLTVKFLRIEESSPDCKNLVISALCPFYGEHQAVSKLNHREAQ